MSQDSSRARPLPQATGPQKQSETATTDPTLPLGTDFGCRDPRVADLLEVIAGDPVHADDRERVLSAILRDAEQHAGQVNPNRVRAALTNDHGLTVYPRMLGPLYYALGARGVLRHTGWTTNDDRRGHNAGKPQRLYRLDWHALAEVRRAS